MKTVGLPESKGNYELIPLEETGKRRSLTREKGNNTDYMVVGIEDSSSGSKQLITNIYIVLARMKVSTM